MVFLPLNALVKRVNLHKKKNVLSLDLTRKVEIFRNVVRKEGSS